MEFDKLAQAPTTTTIQCTIGTESKQFTLSDAEDISTGIRLHLTAPDTDTTWTLTQQDTDTYHLSEDGDEQIDVLTESDIVIK